jgi:hypothetical protein
MTNEREDEQWGEAADNEYERRKDNERDAERKREGKAMKLNIEELKRLAETVVNADNSGDAIVASMEFMAAIDPAAILELIRQGKELAKQCAEWERLSRNWLASSDAAQRLSGYQSLARKASDACDIAEKLQAELLAERARLDFVLTKAIALCHGQLTWTDEDMRTHFIGICEGEDARSIIDYLWMEDDNEND